jgi:hypothetical protein
MTWTSWKITRALWASAMVGALLLALSLAACGGSASSATTRGEIPQYQPSKVVLKIKLLGTTVLKSPDSVSRIGDFYKEALAKGGWELRSSSSSRYHASFTARRTGEGVSVSVYPRGSGSGISISRHAE